MYSKTCLQRDIIIQDRPFAQRHSAMLLAIPFTSIFNTQDEIIYSTSADMQYWLSCSSDSSCFEEEDFEDTSSAQWHSQERCLCVALGKRSGEKPPA